MIGVCIIDRDRQCFYDCQGCNHIYSNPELEPEDYGYDPDFLYEKYREEKIYNESQDS